MLCALYNHGKGGTDKDCRGEALGDNRNGETPWPSLHREVTTLVKRHNLVEMEENNE